MPWHEIAREMNGQRLIDVGYYEVVELLDKCQKLVNGMNSLIYAHPRLGSSSSGRRSAGRELP